MRFKWPRTSAVAISAFLAGVATAYLAHPVYKSAIIWANQDTYGQLVFACDNAMREHLIAKHELSMRPSEESVSLLEATEVGLMDCQDYDIMRKKLIQLGLDENDLALMGLYAIEANHEALSTMVHIHEIKR
ncbi:TIGR03982 family His-Xaa-Ser system protein [Pacificispira sp.]|uniref:TIGR03982 family His-Xaa-Ser system protein n=1 Tax=Pacificispira sp. TaxID=2888761 RepID=UPI003B521B1D